MKRTTILCLGILLQLSLLAQPKLTLKSANDFYSKGDYYNAIVNYEIYLGIRKPVISFTPYGQKKIYPVAKSDSASAADNIIATSQLVTAPIAYKLAESYRSQNHYLRAEKCYARLLQTTDTTYPLARYWFAVCLRSNNKLEEATAQLKTFISENQSDKARVAMGNKELATIRFINQQMNSDKQKQFTVNKLKGNRNGSK